MHVLVNMGNEEPILSDPLGGGTVALDNKRAKIIGLVEF